MMKQVTYTEPYIQFIEQTLDSMKRGQLLCPQFQRPFVWKINNQISLLESIKNGLPIGSIMVWKTNNLDIDYYNQISGYTFFDKNLVDISKNNSKTYILDGLQRLTTLYVALNKKENNSENLENQTSFYYDLKRKTFLSETQIKTITNPMLMPLNILLDNVSLLKFQRNLFKFISNEEEADELVNEIDEISAAFRQYKIPVIPVVTDDISVATSSFKRINSEGVKVDDIQMIHALTWELEYDFNSEIENLKNKELDPLGWGDIPVEIIIKTIKLILNKNIYKTDPVDLSKSIVENKDIIYVAICYLKKAINFIFTTLKIPSYLFIPYSLQIVVFAYFFKYLDEFNLDFDSSLKKLFEGWFWFTSYSEAFSGMSDNDFRKCIVDFEYMIDFGEPYWTNKKVKCQEPIFNEKYNFRSVRTKLSILNLARLQEKFNYLSNNKIENPFELLRNFGTEAISNLFSDKEIYIDPFDDVKMHKSLGNKVILNPSINVEEFKNSSFCDDLEFRFIDGFNKENYIQDFDFYYDADLFIDSYSFFSERLAYLHEAEANFFENNVKTFWDGNLYI